MKSANFFRTTLVLIVLPFTSFTFAATSVEELELECIDMGGEFSIRKFPMCHVEEVTETPYELVARAAGNSGLGWTEYGIEETITIDTYSGVQSHRRTKCSKKDAKKCEKPKTTWEWKLTKSRIVSEETVPQGCVNPGGRDMGFHRQCGF